MNGNWLPQWGTKPATREEQKLQLTIENDVVLSNEDLHLLNNQQNVPKDIVLETTNINHETETGWEPKEEIPAPRTEQLPRRKVKFTKISKKTSTSSLSSSTTAGWLSWTPRTQAGDKEDGRGSKGVRDGKISAIGESVEFTTKELSGEGSEGDDNQGDGHVEGNDGNKAKENGNDDINDDENGNVEIGNAQEDRIGHEGASSNGEGDNDDNGDNDLLPEKNGDEIDDHVASSKNRKKLWGFWNAEESKERKEKVVERTPLFTNTILKTTPSLLSKDGARNEARTLSDDAHSTQLDTENVDSDNGDDAVLYKPHDTASQFNKINTHKNENLTENDIVPDWNTCLHNQKLDLAQTTSQAASTTEGIRSHPFDIKSWRNYFSHLSTRFGIGSGDQQSLPGSQQTESAVEKEFNSTYERNYKLYGRSLAKLPYYKRACSPNFNLYYTKANIPQKRQKTQMEEDAEDENSISITNDAMGNLLINHRNRKVSAPAITYSDIVSQKTGSLKKIKKILIVGVHGFFPTKMIRPIIGAPKGTSLKFASEAEKAVIRYCLENDLIDERETHNVSIQKIALEKEGKIFDRVDFFLEILTKWADELNDADFIFIASHSQGCVVSVILFARLIQLGILRHPLQKRIGLLGMAGVNNGPFYSMDKTFFMKAYSAIEHDSMLELFELTKFDSAQSMAYKEAMQIIINANVKICFIGSINDQLVPLYSALASHVFHPNIYRACYIDHSSRTPEFIKRLVSVCCQLQNLGFFDNNVIKELSAVLAGPFTGGGHSRIYNDGKVYDLGLKFALDTDDLVIPCGPLIQATAPAKVTDGSYDEVVRMPATNQIYNKGFNIGKIGTNPFVLPWCLRGLIFNIEKNWPVVPPRIIFDGNTPNYKSATQELEGLYDLFDKWKPDSKVLKELKFRLNGIRASKL